MVLRLIPKAARAYWPVAGTCFHSSLHRIIGKTHICIYVNTMLNHISSLAPVGKEDNHRGKEDEYIVIAVFTQRLVYLLASYIYTVMIV